MRSPDPTASSRPRWRTWMWGALAVLTCPCHLPILIALLSGTMVGAFVTDHVVVALLVLLALFGFALVNALGSARRLR
ncbi:broad-spectrum mercury transporter MerE (plasmid) [Burkholderia thailandensis]|uniref:broad-spectrum mercury transporter MerE n=1 Tax=Burkholderia thailandensis TaxID=57975 RepID=UPI00192DBE05|nr:broad-spectrum mercury transporter MerE [Burkholderia thailandensis]MBS2132271.1 broad-spectrum mercury transporter MerE [Burkholderia thailandensis]QRA15361.1 broad-spectrum mercury transporter MerE [Burkholderia thailandensis]